jgi:hypothetical protein
MRRLIWFPCPISRGELVPTKFGKKTLFAAPDLAALLNKRRAKPLSDEACEVV